MKLTFEVYNKTREEVYKKFLKEIYGKLLGTYKNIEVKGETSILGFEKGELVFDIEYKIENKNVEIILILFKGMFKISQITPVENAPKKNFFFLKKEEILNTLCFKEENLKELYSEIINKNRNEIEKNFEDFSDQIEKYVIHLILTQKNISNYANPDLKNKNSESTKRIEEIVLYLQKRFERMEKFEPEQDESPKDFEDRKKTYIRKYNFFIKFLEKVKKKGSEDEEKSISNKVISNFLKFFRKDNIEFLNSTTFLIKNSGFLGNKDLFVVLKYFEERGLKKSDVNKMIVIFPAILGCSLDRTEGIIDYFEKRGIGKEDINKMLVILPPILGCSLDRTKGIIGYFEERGLKKSDVNKMLVIFPQILGCSLDRTEGIIDYFEERGIGKEDVNKMLVSCPQILGYSLDRTEGIIDYFEKRGIGKEDINKMLVILPQILGCSLGRTKGIIGYFEERGLKKSDVNKMLVIFPVILGCSLDRTEGIIDYLQKRGIGKEDVNKMLVSYPQILGYRLDKTEGIIDYFEKRGIGKEDINKMLVILPPILGYSLDRTKGIIGYFEERGLKKSDVNKMIVSYPQIFGYSLDRTKKSCSALEEKYEKELNLLLIEYPYLLYFSSDFIKKNTLVKLLKIAEKLQLSKFLVKIISGDEHPYLLVDEDSKKVEGGDKDRETIDKIAHYLSKEAKEILRRLQLGEELEDLEFKKLEEEMQKIVKDYNIQSPF